MDSVPDSLLAELLSMGFDQELIAACQLALKSSNISLTLQSATEWLLQHSTLAAQKPNESPTQLTTPSLRLGFGGTTQVGGVSRETPSADTDYSRPMSSGSTLTYNEPVKSRYDLSDEQKKQKEQFFEKERDNAVKKARERRLADIRARAAVKQQIEEDKRRRAEKAGQTILSTTTVATTNTSPNVTSSASNVGTESGKKTIEQCRVQIRFPNGDVLRHTFSSTATLYNVCEYVKEQRPYFLTVQLVQPFPHREFSAEEHTHTLQSLGLCPSVSLVVSKPSSHVQPHTSHVQSHTPVYNTAPQEPQDSMDTSQSREEESDEDMDNEDTNEVGISPHPRPHSGLPRPVIPGRPAPLPALPGGIRPPRGIPPGMIPPQGRMPPGMVPLPGGMPPGMLPNQGGMPVGVPPRGMLPGFPGNQVNARMVFGGEGHRLGGREVPMKFGDPQAMSKYVSDTARSAAEKRAKMLSKLSSEDRASRVGTDIPSLEVLCLRNLARWSSVNWLPNCSHLPPRIAQRLLMGLAEAKQLHSKTLNAFLKCPLQALVLDNYCYATNQLLEMFRYFPSLTHLSLVSCTLITDKSMTQLLAYLPNLIHLNLNGCHQLSDNIFQSFKGFHQLAVIRLSQLKLTDTGMKLLLRQPILSLKDIDLSFTGVTVSSLKQLCQGAPNLESLNIESTKVSDVTPLLSLEHLHSLNVSQCPLEGGIHSLAACRALKELSLSGIPVDCNELQQLSGLQLTSLSLPDRNLFFDEHMGVVSGFPLIALNLTGYCNITDIGIIHISRMTSLTQLSLSRTRLTDDGMVYLQGLVNLKQLSLDNTLITDEGIMHIAELEQLEDLSVSDTRVTSKFILDGALTRLTKLNKLNLVRTFVDDKGLFSLSLPSLLMLNIDWTCATEEVSIDTLREQGCRSLETLRNRNIEQPTLTQLQQQQQQQQVVLPGGRGGGLLAQDNSDDDMMEEEENY